MCISKKLITVLTLGVYPAIAQATIFGTARPHLPGDPPETIENTVYAFIGVAVYIVYGLLLARLIKKIKATDDKSSNPAKKNRFNWIAKHDTFFYYLPFIILGLIMIASAIFGF